MEVRENLQKEKSFSQITHCEKSILYFHFKIRMVLQKGWKNFLSFFCFQTMEFKYKSLF